MRAIDWTLGIFTGKYWFTGDDSELDLCPLLKDPDVFLNYLDGIKLKPGINIPVCPMCGDEHRWRLIRSLLEYVQYLEPERHTELLDFIFARYGAPVGKKSTPWFPDKSILTEVIVRKPKLPPEPANMTAEQKQQWDALIATITEKFYRELKVDERHRDLKSMLARLPPAQS